MTEEQNVVSVKNLQFLSTVKFEFSSKWGIIFANEVQLKILQSSEEQAAERMVREPQIVSPQKRNGNATDIIYKLQTTSSYEVYKSRLRTELKQRQERL